MEKIKHKPPKIIKERRELKKSRIQFWKIFCIEATLFFTTSFLAIICASELNKMVTVRKAYLPKTSLQDFLFSFLFITFFVLIFVVFKKADKFKELIYKGLFILAVFWGCVVILSLFLPVFGAVLITGILITLWFKLSKIWVHDLLMVLSLAGTASFFGLGFSPPVVIALLFVFSAYDFIAVYKTKHMVKMAEQMIENKAILGIIIPKKIRDLKVFLKESDQKTKFIVIAAGDFIFPLMLFSSVLKENLERALIVGSLSFLGFLFGFIIFAFKKQRGPMPMLPPIALFSIIGYLISKLI